MSFEPDAVVFNIFKHSPAKRKITGLFYLSNPMIAPLGCIVVVPVRIFTAGHRWN